VIVVDSAAIVDVLTGAPGADGLRDRIRHEELHAPALLDYEVVSALRGLTLGGAISAGRAEDALTDYADLPIRLWEGADALRRRAFQLRDNVSAYDAAYIVLAESLGCPLLTRDARLARATGHTAEIDLL
jgi:predicted nucleic acid-binding protein